MRRRRMAISARGHPYRTVLFILHQSFVVQNPGGYAITLIVFLVFMDEKRNFANAWCVLCAYHQHLYRLQHC